ncbi:hypothetical protein F8388_005248 [Cannabis sativa]|uniref:Uncharacterized protein n=1 Tax=Cannabis sativa TaxID=3483 RepID=A0A7J6FWC4_CANSA|nr:hypothetical protein F8388_005248 [Cannabis sativa]KAF4375041.1 hypothetical protein G4B88_004792 [Cannabis sativa]
MSKAVSNLTKHLENLTQRIRNVDDKLVEQNNFIDGKRVKMPETLKTVAPLSRGLLTFSGASSLVGLKDIADSLSGVYSEDGVDNRLEKSLRNSIRISYMK